MGERGGEGLQKSYQGILFRLWERGGKKTAMTKEKKKNIKQPLAVNSSKNWQA